MRALALVLAAVLSACAHAPWSHCGVTLESAEGRFRVRAPAALEPYSQDVELNGRRATFHSFMGTSDRVIYTVSYCDCPGFDVDLTGQTLRSGVFGGQTVKHDKIESLKLGRHSGIGEEIHLSDDRYSMVLTQRVYTVGDRFYQLLVMRLASKPLPPEAVEFLDSFEIEE